jgi:hypothetical protein
MINIYYNLHQLRAGIPSLIQEKRVYKTSQHARLANCFPFSKVQALPTEFQIREPTVAGDYGHRASPARHWHPVPPGGGPGTAVLLRAAEPVRSGDAAAQRDLRRRAQGDTTAADHVPRHTRAVPLPGLWRRLRHLPSVSSYLAVLPPALPAHGPLLFGYGKKKILSPWLLVNSVSMAFSAV